MRLAVSAYLGDWDVLLPLLAADPRQINVYREPRRYTPLHHAARHGAPPEVVGALLSLGADPCLLTASKQQRAFDIAVELHPSRLDLQYLLQPRRLSIAQLLRKAVAMSPGLFHEGDGNQRLFDRLVMSLDGPPDPDHATNIEACMAEVFRLVTGVDLGSQQTFCFSPCEGVQLEVDPVFWSRRLVPLAVAFAQRGEFAPLERAWAVASDLFDPAPDACFIREDRHVWSTLRRALALVALPPDAGQMEGILRSAYSAVVNDSRLGEEIAAARLAHARMGTGMGDRSFWETSVLPSLLLRFQWLQRSWSAVQPPE